MAPISDFHYFPTFPLAPSRGSSQMSNNKKILKMTPNKAVLLSANEHRKSNFVLKIFTCWNAVPSVDFGVDKNLIRLHGINLMTNMQLCV